MALNLLSGSEDEDTFTLRQIFVEETNQRGGGIFGISLGRIDENTY